MKNILILIILLSIFLLKCNIVNQKNNNSSQIQYYKFEANSLPIKIIEFDTVTYKENYIQKFHHVTIFKYHFNEKENQIVKFLLTESETYIYKIITDKKGDIIKVDSIKIPKFIIKNKIQDFGIIGKDSIFYILHYNLDQETGEYSADSSLVLANFNGEIINLYRINDIHIPYHNSTNIETESQYIITNNLYEQFCFKDQYVFIFFKPFGSYLGQYNQKEIPLAGYLNLKDGKFQFLNVHYPDIKWDKTFYNYSETNFFVTFAHDGDLLFSFKYSPTLIKCNYKNGTVEQIHLKNRIIDTIYPALEIENIPQDILHKPYPQNWTITFDKFRNYYLIETLLPPKEYNYLSFVSVYDTNFNIVGQFLNEKAKLFYLPLPAGILVGGNILNYKFKDGNNIQIIREIENHKANNQIINKPLSNFFNNYCNISTKNSLITIIWADIMCYGISQNIIDFYITNNIKLYKNKKYLIVITQNPNIIKTIRKNKNQNIIIDSNLFISKYSTAPNPKLMPQIIIYKNNKIINDTTINILQPKDFIDFQYFIKDYTY